MVRTEGIERLIGNAKRRAAELDQLSTISPDEAAAALRSFDAAALRILIAESSRELAAIKSFKISTTEGVFAS